jgi:hypothetical protein
MNWTEEQINSIAPDPASIKAGKGLATPNKWSNIGLSEIALWGECQGSGSTPYKTQIDLRELAFKCSCPSRKFPCKHSLGIMFLLLQKKELFNNTTLPTWVEEWLNSRELKKQKQEEKKETKKEVDPEKKAKTEAKRIDTVAEGINELELWLKDLLRKGINTLPEESYNFFQNIASRMIDAKAPNLAKKVEELSGLPNLGANWAELFLEKVANIYLLIQGFKNLESLSKELQAEVKTQIGWTYTQEEVLKDEGINDTWIVLAQNTEEDNNLKVRKIYLLGLASHKFALILDYAYGNRPFENIDLIQNKTYQGTLAFYPSAYPLRAIIKPESWSNNLEAVNYLEKQGLTQLEQVYSEYSKALALNPFIETIPVLIKKVTPICYQDKFILLDEEKNFITINTSYSNFWHLLALSGGHEIELFGEWNGKTFYPLTLITMNKKGKLVGTSL